MINQYRLMEVVEYHPDSGLFFWRDGYNGFTQDNGSAGTTDHQGYTILRIDKRNYRAHRLAYLYLLGRMPSGVIDHINGIEGDNRPSNLRDVTQSENMRNMKLRSCNKSGIHGVYKDQFSSKWIVTIGVEGRSISLGRFESLLDAASARKSAENKYNFHENHGKR